MRGYGPLDMVKLPVPDSFCFSVVHPHIMVSTKEARDVLRKEIPMRDAVTQWGNVGGLVAGLLTSDMELIGPFDEGRDSRTVPQRFHTRL